MTGLLNKILSARSTREINEVMFSNLKHFNKFPVLDFYARRRKAQIRKTQSKFNQN